MVPDRLVRHVPLRLHHRVHESEWLFHPEHSQEDVLVVASVEDSEVPEIPEIVKGAEDQSVEAAI